MKMKKNVELLEKVKLHILEEPRRYNQDVAVKNVSTEVAPCGTQACILGWVVRLGAPRWRCSCGMNDCYAGADGKAAKLLGLSHDEAEVVYSGGGSLWPSRFREQLRKAKTPRGKARAAANFIDYLIAGGKVIE
jgi:hypothetical protein